MFWGVLDIRFQQGATFSATRYVVIALPAALGREGLGLRVRNAFVQHPECLHLADELLQLCGAFCPATREYADCRMVSVDEKKVVAAAAEAVYGGDEQVRSFIGFPDPAQRDLGTLVVRGISLEPKGFRELVVQGSDGIKPVRSLVRERDGSFCKRCGATDRVAIAPRYASEDFLQLFAVVGADPAPPCPIGLRMGVGEGVPKGGVHEVTPKNRCRRVIRRPQGFRSLLIKIIEGERMK